MVFTIVALTSCDIYSAPRFNNHQLCDDQVEYLEIYCDHKISIGESLNVIERVESVSE